MIAGEPSKTDDTPHHGAVRYYVEPLYDSNCIPSYHAERRGSCHLNHSERTLRGSDKRSQGRRAPGLKMYVVEQAEREMENIRKCLKDIPQKVENQLQSICSERKKDAERDIWEVRVSGNALEENYEAANHNSNHPVVIVKRLSASDEPAITIRSSNSDTTPKYTAIKYVDSLAKDQPYTHKKGTAFPCKHHLCYTSNECDEALYTTQHAGPKIFAGDHEKIARGHPEDISTHSSTASCNYSNENVESSKVHPLHDTSVYNDKPRVYCVRRCQEGYEEGQLQDTPQSEPRHEEREYAIPRHPPHQRYMGKILVDEGKHFHEPPMSIHSDLPTPGIQHTNGSLSYKSPDTLARQQRRLQEYYYPNYYPPNPADCEPGKQCIVSPSLSPEKIHCCNRHDTERITHYVKPENFGAKPWNERDSIEGYPCQCSYAESQRKNHCTTVDSSLIQRNEPNCRKPLCTEEQHLKYPHPDCPEHSSTVAAQNSIQHVPLRPAPLYDHFKPSRVYPSTPYVAQGGNNDIYVHESSVAYPVTHLRERHAAHRSVTPTRFRVTPQPSTQRHYEAHVVTPVAAAPEVDVKAHKWEVIGPFGS